MPPALRVAVIGCGQVARFKHLRVLKLQQDMEIAALCETDTDRLEDVAAQFDCARRETDCRRVFEDPNIDIIAVCVPARDHADVAVEAIKSGKHVLIEKPLALNLDDCDRLVEAARHGGGKVAVGFHMRWHRQIQQARRLIETGSLGQIEMIRSVWNSPIPFDGSQPAWRNRRQTGGGVLAEIAPHHFDLWRYLLGREVEEVFTLTHAEGEADETAVLSARLEGSVLASATFSERSSHDIEIEILGRAGRLRLSCLRFDGLEFFPMGGVPGGLGPRLQRWGGFLKELPRAIRPVVPGGPYMESYAAEWRHFASCIRNGTRPGCSLEDGRRAQEIVLAAAESASTGKPVPVSRAPRTLPPIASA